MIFIFGVRKSKLQEREVRVNANCPSCDSLGSLVSDIEARYFHFFWIPIFPLNKRKRLKCTNCQSSHSIQEFPSNVQQLLISELKLAKGPIWQGCGCLVVAAIVVLFFVLSLIMDTIGSYYYENLEKNQPTTDVQAEKDWRMQAFESDYSKVTLLPDPLSDSISFYLKTCYNPSVDGVDIQSIRYFSRVSGDTLMVLMKFQNVNGIKISSRKYLLYAVEDCLKTMNLQNVSKVYIGIGGKIFLIVAKSPLESDLDGVYANEKMMYPFYGQYNVELDTVRIE